MLGSTAPALPHPGRTQETPTTTSLLQNFHRGEILVCLRLLRVPPQITHSAVQASVIEYIAKLGYDVL